MRRGEIYIAEFSSDKAKGSEQKGTRPVLIIQNDAGNKFSPTTIVALITSQEKPDLPTHVKLRNYLAKDSIVLCEQIRTISKTRLKEFICTLSDFKMKEINNALRISLNLKEEIQ